MLRTIPNITFVEGVPSDLEFMINPAIRNLVVRSLAMIKELPICLLRVVITEI